IEVLPVIVDSIIVIVPDKARTNTCNFRIGINRCLQHVKQVSVYHLSVIVQQEDIFRTGGSDPDVAATPVAQVRRVSYSPYPREFLAKSFSGAVSGTIVYHEYL